jgi:hypothetical protein
MDLVMGSRRVVNGNTTILPNCGGTNGAGCNQDLIVEDDGEVILEPPNNFFPFWAASVLTDIFNLRPLSITIDQTNNNIFMVDGNALVPTDVNKFILKSSYIPSGSTQIAPTGNFFSIPPNGPTGQYYKYNAYVTPGTIVYLNGRLYTYDYYVNPVPATLPLSGLYLISMPVNSPTMLTITSPGIIFYPATFSNPTPPSPSNYVLGSTLATDGTDIYYLKDPNAPNQPIFKLINPSAGGSAISTNVTGTITTGTQNSASAITGMRVYNNNLYFTNQYDTTVNCVFDLSLTPPLSPINIVAGLQNSSGTVPAYPSSALPAPPGVPADTAEFDPQDIEIVDTASGPIMYIADGRNSRVLQMTLVSDTTASSNTVKLFAGCDPLQYPFNGNFNNPPLVNQPPLPLSPPANRPALGETNATTSLTPPSGAPPYSLVAANSANLVSPMCLCKVPSAPILPSVGPTQILVGTNNNYGGLPALTHLPLMLLKYYY